MWGAHQENESSSKSVTFRGGYCRNVPLNSSRRQGEKKRDWRGGVRHSLVADRRSVRKEKTCIRDNCYDSQHRVDIYLATKKKKKMEGSREGQRLKSFTSSEVPGE